jgi:tetratricopeptide (TPR) repeat protein
MSPPEPSAATPASPRLTLVVIARNEAALIGGCLDSARAVVDAMILLDSNRKLLLAMLAERPEDAYLRYQLGKDCEVYDDFEEAARQYQRALQASALLPRQPAYRHDLVVRALFALKRAGALEQAIALAEQEMPHWPQSPDFFFALGDLLLDWAIRNPEQAAQEILPVVEQAWLKCLEIGEQPSLEGSVRGRGSFLAAHNLAVLYEQLGRLDEAADYHSRAQALRQQANALLSETSPPGSQR